LPFEEIYSEEPLTGCSLSVLSPVTGISGLLTYGQFAAHILMNPAFLETILSFVQNFKYHLRY
jgi:hypothetical protein